MSFLINDDLSSNLEVSVGWAVVLGVCNVIRNDIWDYWRDSFLLVGLVVLRRSNVGILCFINKINDVC